MYLVAILIGAIIGIVIMSILQINRLKDIEVEKANVEFYKLYYHTKEKTIIVEFDNEFKTVKDKEVKELLKLIK